MSLPMDWVGICVANINGVSVGIIVHVGASVTGGSMVGVSKINGVDVNGAAINV